MHFSREAIIIYIIQKMDILDYCKFYLNKTGRNKMEDEEVE